MTKQKELPVLPIKDSEIVVFPGQCCEIDVGRSFSLNAIASAREEFSDRIIVAFQKNFEVSMPNEEDFYDVCVEAEIKQVTTLSSDDERKCRLIIVGLHRCNLLGVGLRNGSHYVGTIEKIQENDFVLPEELKGQLEEARKVIKKNFAATVTLKNPNVPQTSLELSAMVDDIISQIKASHKDKISILKQKDPRKRLEKLYKIMADLIIQRKNSNQHGACKSAEEEEGVKGEIEKLEEALATAGLPPEAQKIAEQEIRRLKMMSPSSSEFQVTINYVDNLVGLPWSKSSEDCFDLDVAKKFLEEDHYGLEKVKERIIEFLAVKKLAPNQKGSILCFSGSPGTGKAQPLDALVLTPNGYIQMGEVKVGTEVMTPSGDVAKVTGVFPQGEKDIYNVLFSDGVSTECCDEHLWLTETSAYRRARNKTNDGRKVRSLSEIKDTLRCEKDQRVNHSVPAVGKINFKEEDFIIDPYLLGSLLGDGTLSKNAFSTKDSGMVKRVRKYLGSMGCKMIKVGKYDYNISQKSKKESYNFSGKNNKSQLHKELLSLNLFGTHSWNKFIPQKYLYSSFKSRLSLLQGLLDTDGSMSGSSIDFSSASKKLSEDVKFLVESMGGRAKYYVSKSAYTYKGVKLQGRDRHRLAIHMPKTINPFRLQYKKDKFNEYAKKSRSYKRYIVGVEFVGRKEAQCIYVDHPDHLYITNNFIVTHNTSICKSIARSMNKEYVRISLGGLHDEAEIRGHRKTYIGAMPGRIIQSLKKAGVNNPIFVLDEIDKLSKDYRGDPSSALLEVLDPEQNNTFQDNYINTPFDLSKVFFITTANDLGSIPQALRDRLEIIEIPGYSPFDKKKIAQNYLIPKQKKENGIEDLDLSVSEKALEKVIEEYTNEAGVRRLERLCGALMRKVAVQVASNKKPPTNISISMVPKLLGPPRVFSDKANVIPLVGISTGLAWSQNGGSILFVESMFTPGNGNIKVTGSVGKVLEESANAAFTWIRSHALEYGVDIEKISSHDIHIHLPAGATPKDGPSAGIAITASLLSTIVDKPIANDIAMTGEISLRGRVLPIGGLKEKVLAAHRAGIKKVIFPKDNSFDLEDIPSDVLKEIEMIPVTELSEAIPILIESIEHPKRYCGITPVFQVEN